jgi:hypothetical protein
MAAVSLAVAGVSGGVPGLVSVAGMPAAVAGVIAGRCLASFGGRCGRRLARGFRRFLRVQEGFIGNAAELLRQGWVDI